jgi:predicted phage terminase large subunit-like protein
LSELLTERKAWEEARKRALTDRIFLACEVLGYDFTEETHRELFDTYPAFHPVEEKPWADQFNGKDVLVLWSRGHFKSTAVVVLAVQAILNNPDIRILLMQGTIKVTKGLLKEILSHFDGTHSRSKLNYYFPKFCGTARALKATTEKFTTLARTRLQLQQATVTVASPKSIKTGQHYDAGFFDDLVNDANYRSPELLEKVEEDFNMARPLVDPGCARFVSGTRYAFGDLYENIIKRNKGEWSISVTTCWKNNDPKQGPRFPQYKTKDGRLVGLTREMLMQIASDSPGIFASQYLNYPIAASQQVLTEENLLAAVVAPNDAPALSSAVLFVDLARESDSGNKTDDCVIIAGKKDARGAPYVVDMIGGVWSVSTLAIHIVNMTLKHRPLKVMIEKTAPAAYLAEYLRVVGRDKGINIPVDFIKVDNRPDAKNIRVGSMAGHIKNKRMFFFAGLSCWDKFVEQAITFPKGRYGHDDWPDTAALCCQFFQGSFIGAFRPLASKNPMIDLLSRDPVMQGIDNMGTETGKEFGDCGSDFAC